MCFYILGNQVTQIYFRGQLILRGWTQHSDECLDLEFELCCSGK
jgi:hypothetical protein